MAVLEKRTYGFLSWFFSTPHDILPVKSPCTLAAIERGASLVLLVVAGYGWCCKIFGIWNNRLLSYPLWKLVCGILRWVPTRDISLWPAVFLEIDIFTTLVTSHIYPGIWPSSIATTISTVVALEINLLQSLIDWLFNGHIKKGCRSKGTVSSGNPPNNSTKDLLKWLTKNPVVSDTKDLATATIPRNNKN